MPRILVLMICLLLAACGAQPAAPAATPTLPPTAVVTAPQRFDGQRLVLMTHDSFAISADVIAAFEAQTGATLEILPSGDAGTALNKAILSKANPQADLFFGVDNTFLSRALNAGIFEPYNAPALAQIPARFRLDPQNRLLPIDYGFVSINYDKAELERLGLQPPTRLEDLTSDQWKGQLVVQNPATSSPGLAFMLATIAVFGERGGYTWLDFWRELRANEVLVAEGWSDAYYTHFSGSSGNGPRPLVVSYASSPAAEVVFSDPPVTEPPTGFIEAGSFEQIEFAGILAGTQQRALAERFLDFMLSTRFQEDIPLQMFVYPVLPEARLPEVFEQFARAPQNPATLTPEQIEQNRERWIDEWTQVVLR